MMPARTESLGTFSSRHIACAMPKHSLCRKSEQSIESIRALHLHFSASGRRNAKFCMWIELSEQEGKMAGVKLFSRCQLVVSPRAESLRFQHHEGSLFLAAIGAN